MLQKIFFALMELNITMSCVILILLTFSLCCGKRFTAHCRYVLWIAVILRLCFPVSMPYLPALWEIQLPERVVQQEYDIMLTEPETSGTPETFLPEGQPVGNENVPDNAANTETITETETDRIQSELPLRKVRISPVNGLAVIWAAGAFLLFTVRITGYLIVSSRLRYTRTLPQEKQTDLCRRLGEKLGLQAAALPALYITREVHSPMLCGFLRPVVLLPDITLTDNQLTGILAHELIHRKRCDLWIKLICAVVVSLHWFNPLVYIAAGKCCREMELSCDERVLAGKDEAVRLTYGKVMLDIIRRCRRPVSGLTTHFNPGKSAVRERFESILDGTGKFRGLWLCGLVVLLCAATGSMVAFGKADLPADNEPMPEAVVNDRTAISDTKITYYTIPMTSGEQYACFQGKLTEYFPTHYGDIDLSVLAEQKMPVPVNSEAAPETLFAENRSSYLGSHSDVFVVTGTLLQGGRQEYAYVFCRGEDAWTVTALPAPAGTVCKGVVLRGVPHTGGLGWHLGLLADDGSVRFFRSDDGSVWEGGDDAFLPAENAWLVQFSKHTGVGGDTLCLVFDAPEWEKEQIWLSFDWGMTFTQYDIPLTEYLPGEYTDMVYLQKTSGTANGEYILYFQVNSSRNSRYVRVASARNSSESKASLYTYDQGGTIGSGLFPDYRYKSPGDLAGNK